VDAIIILAGQAGRLDLGRIPMRFLALLLVHELREQLKPKDVVRDRMKVREVEVPLVIGEEGRGKTDDCAA